MEKRIRSLVALLALWAILTPFAHPSLASIEAPYGSDGLKFTSAQMVRELRSPSSCLSCDIDTTYVGFTPEDVIKNEAGSIHPLNYWRIWAGHGSAGYHRPTNGVPHKGLWDWEVTVHGDSLQGWWPLRNVYTSTGGRVLDDSDRPWWAIDIGNNANYVPNGSGAKGTFGVDGVWHVDHGSSVPAPGLLPSPTWDPLGGAASAWMGLRAHGDNTHVDPLTGNPFNEDVLMYNGVNATSPSGNDKRFPGYGSQMDQMLYRDIDFRGRTDQGIEISFKYRTNMSMGFDANPATRTGWFLCDPLAVTSWNYISSTAAGNFNPRVDRFTVYVGAGVDGNQWLGSDGVLRDVYDPKHRWFAEVLHCDRDPAGDPLNPPPLFYMELLSVVGDTPPTTANFTLSNAEIAPFLAKNGRLRLVFRVKTNRGFDDEGISYSSGHAGAAVVDDATYRVGAGPVNDGDVNWGTFEVASAINNDPNVSAVSAWKSTGKPPAIFHHVHRFSGLVYEDLCGQKGDRTRVCDLSGVIVSAGDHDRAEAAGGRDGTPDRELADGMISPTIIFADDDHNPDTRNPHGLYGEGGGGGVGDVEATEDYYIDYEIYTGAMDPLFKSNLWRIGCQSYPADSKVLDPDVPDAYPAWGQLRFPDFLNFHTNQHCFRVLEPLQRYGLIRTSNASGIPDSIRIYVGKVQQCFRFGISVACSPHDGVYWDNVSLTLIDGVPAPMSVNPWDWWNDAFPANADPAIVGIKASFDTTAAYTQTGYNTAEATGDPTRPDIPGESVVIVSSGDTKRVDMVFRVLPGPGNYHPIGSPGVGKILKRPDGLGDATPGRQPSDVATPGDGSWWGTYMANPGDYASGFPIDNLKGGWDANTWVSARCDTAEANLYALHGRGVLGGPPDPCRWMSTYHESDPRFSILGIDRFRCFVRCSACAVTDVVCDGTVPMYLPVGTSGITKEGTKIIPDGLLTPGAHVQYFFRNQHGAGFQPVPDGFCPETTTVSPQIGEESTDGHRWQQFGVLPDRWKDSQYFHPVFQKLGRGPACLLVVDNNDRRGNERVWVSVADTIGATLQQKWGAHNGWHAIGLSDKTSDAPVNINDPVNHIRFDPKTGQKSVGFTVKHGGLPGTTWDMYQVKAAEALGTAAGTIGSRLAALGSTSAQGPTPAMLKAYYTLILLLTGDLNSGILGPYGDRSQNDSALLIDWLQSGDTNSQNRGLWAIGDGFVEDLTLSGSQQADLIFNHFRADLLDPNYSVFSDNTESVADLRVYPQWQGKTAAEEAIYGVRNLCLWTNDVLDKAAPPLLTTETSEYQAKAGGGFPGPYYAGIFKAWDPTSPYQTLVDGWDIEHLTTRNDVHTKHRSTYFFKIFTNVWAKIWQVAGTPLLPLDVPTLDDGALVNFVNLRNNPLRAGHATIHFGLAQTDRVEVRVYDVSGRSIRTLADRVFPAGSHELVWDGADDAGRQAARGVYFTRLRYRGSGFADTKKVTVLK